MKKLVIKNKILLRSLAGLMLCSAMTLLPVSAFTVSAPLYMISGQITSEAAQWPEPAAVIQSEGAILIDADSGSVLYEKNADTPYYPASITKVLTAVIVLEHVKNLDDMVTFSYEATNTNLENNATVIGAVAGDKLSVRDCLYCLLLHSANDCANALAEYVAGSNEAFADLMNQKAQELGCTGSHFVTPSGLNNPDHYTTCRDYAKIMQYAIKNPTFRQIDATQVYTHAPISKYPEASAPENTVYAHHRMMRRVYSEYYEGVFAGKTGYTMAAGNTLVTACKRNGMTLICVILNGHNCQYTDTKALFDFGYTSFQSLPVAANDATYSDIGNHFTVDGIPLVNALTFSIDEANHVTLPKTMSFSEVSSQLTYDLSDDERNDGAIARVDYTLDGKAVGNAYIRLKDPTMETEATSKDSAIMESKVQETVPQSISMDSNQGTVKPSVAGQLPQESRENHAPVIFDRNSGRIIIQTPVLRVLVILGLLAAITGIIFLLYYLLERRDEFIRKRRRARMLKHTRDLTREQKARRDLMLNNRNRDRRYRRK